MKVYGPDICKKGRYVVRLMKQENSKDYLIEFYTDNADYANIYFDAIGDILDHKGIAVVKGPICWEKKATTPTNTLNIPVNAKQKDAREWKLFKQYKRDHRKNKPKMPKLKRDLVKWVCKAKRWKITKANSKRKHELEVLWLEDNYNKYLLNPLSLTFR